MKLTEIMIVVKGSRHADQKSGRRQMNLKRREVNEVQERLKWMKWNKVEKARQDSA
jgi:hypothetical protein